jgi:hypothetical protein
MFDNDDLIHSYSRARALADGALVDVSAVAREASIRFPVALTRAVWERSGVPSAGRPAPRCVSASMSATTTGGGRRRWSS